MGTLQESFPGPPDSPCMRTPCASPLHQLLSRDCIRPTSGPRVIYPVFTIHIFVSIPLAC